MLREERDALKARCREEAQRIRGYLPWSRVLDEMDEKLEEGL